MNHISIFDTTLRDGEQTKGVCFNADEKLLITKALIEKGDLERVEIASCKVSDEDHKAVKNIMSWANDNDHGDKVSVLSFVDHKDSVDWLSDTGCQNINLLCKGSKSHCENQLGKTPQEHFEDIAQTIAYARENNLSVSVYLEDWSRGMKESSKYVFDLLHFLQNQNVKTVYLCDTLGVLNSDQTFDFVSQCVNKYPEINFEFHAHNDYGLATANSLSAVKAGVTGLHATVNGLGERAGNASLAEIVVALKDFDIGVTSMNESVLPELSRLCVAYSQKQMPENAPIVGDNVFTHVSGIHVDGQDKANLYEADLKPQRFGREWHFPLSKLSGKKTVQYQLKSLDSVDLSVEEQKKLMKKINQLTEQKLEVSSEMLTHLVKEVRK